MTLGIVTVGIPVLHRVETTSSDSGMTSSLGYLADEQIAWRYSMNAFINRADHVNYTTSNVEVHSETVSERGEYYKNVNLRWKKYRKILSPM